MAQALLADVVSYDDTDVAGRRERVVQMQHEIRKILHLSLFRILYEGIAKESDDVRLSMFLGVWFRPVSPFIGFLICISATGL